MSGMNSLHTLLPELGTFPLFGPVRASIPEIPEIQIQSPAGISEEELAEKVAAARALGVSEATDSVRAEMAAEIEALKADHLKQLDSARKTWVDETADQTIKQIDATLAAMAAEITAALQQALMPFVERIIPLAALAELERIVESATRDDFQGQLFLSGPEDLLMELKTRLAPRELEIISEVIPGIELKARSANFAIITRIANWMTGIQGARP